MLSGHKTWASCPKASKAACPNNNLCVTKKKSHTITVEQFIPFHTLGVMKYYGHRFLFFIFAQTLCDNASNKVQKLLCNGPWGHYLIHLPKTSRVLHLKKESGMIDPNKTLYVGSFAIITKSGLYQ